ARPARLLNSGNSGRGEAVLLGFGQTLENPGGVHDGRFLRVVEGHTDHLDSEERGVGVLGRRGAHAAGKFLLGTHRRRARNVDVHILVVGIDQHRMRMGPTAGLYVVDVLRIADVADIKNPNATQPVGAHALRDALRSAVQTAAKTLTGYEEQITEDGDVALRRRAYVLGHELWIRRIGDIPDDDAVVVTLNDVVVLERQIG